MVTRFAGMYNSNLPFVIGEFAYDSGDNCTSTINYHLIIGLHLMGSRFRIHHRLLFLGFRYGPEYICL